MTNPTAHAEPPATVGRPPGTGARTIDRLLGGASAATAYGTLAGVAALLGLLAWQAWPAVKHFGLGYFTHRGGDPSAANYGILPEIYGTLASSLLGVLFGGVLGLAVAVVLSQDYLPPRAEGVLRTAVELLAAVPSVVYGLWGLTAVLPAVRPGCDWVHDRFGWVPLFATPSNGVGLLPAALVLGVMVLPTIAAVSRDALARVDPALREAAFGLGATRWEVICDVVLPAARRGVVAAFALGFARAAGETMAVTMLIGGRHDISASLFAPANTLTAMLANKFPEAATPMDIGVLMYAALALLALTAAVQTVGERMARGLRGTRP